tara:strand:+ start:1974 stop:2384 length:411 start_codon:yes stop_codon:yes gene_type:complete
MRTTSTGKTKRSFTINDARHAEGCSSKFKNKDYTGDYVNNNPNSAAAKAVTQLCRIKKIKGSCTLYVEMRETTQGSKKKLYKYKVTRKKLATPGPFGNNYENKVKSVDSFPTRCKKSRSSTGRKVSRTRKRKRHLK